MIAKYPSKCRYCGKPIEVGKDEYDIESKSSYHVECHENPKPAPGCYAIADELGFLAHAEVMAADQPLLLLSLARGGASARRDESETPGLFDSIRPM